MDSKQWRSPAFGLAPPGGEVEVGVEIPLDPEEDSPVLVSWPRDSGLVLGEVRATTVKVQNPTGKTVPFAILFIKRKWASIAFFDWRALLAHVRRIGN